jgi:hypothetical protein
MDIGRDLNRYFDALAAVRAPLRDPYAVTPFVAFALLQGVVIAALAMFTEPWLSPVMVPVMRALGGEASLHYPIHLINLPSLYQRIYLPLVASAGFALWTLAVWKLVDNRMSGTRRAPRAFRSHVLHAVLVGVLFVGSSFAVAQGLSSLVGPKTPAMVARALLLLTVALTATLQTFLVYAPVALRLRGGNAWDALRSGARYARRNFFATVLLIVTVLIVHLPLDFLLARADRVAARFSPETVLQLMAGSVALEMATAFILFVGVTELALGREGGMS